MVDTGSGRGGFIRDIVTRRDCWHIDFLVKVFSGTVSGPKFDFFDDFVERPSGGNDISGHGRFIWNKVTRRDCWHIDFLVNAFSGMVSGPIINFIDVGLLGGNNHCFSRHRADGVRYLGVNQ